MRPLWERKEEKNTLLISMVFHPESAAFPLFTHVLCPDVLRLITCSFYKSNPNITAAAAGGDQRCSQLHFKFFQSSPSGTALTGCLQKPISLGFPCFKAPRGSFSSNYPSLWCSYLVLKCFLAYVFWTHSIFSLPLWLDSLLVFYESVVIKARVSASLPVGPCLSVKGNYSSSWL